MTKENGKPQIRFSGFKDTWEQRKLSEIAIMHARIGWQNLRTSEFLDSGDYMLITGTDFMDGAVNFDTCYYVERERYEQDKHIQIRNGSILITKDGTLGKVAYIQGLTMPATLNAGVFNVEIKDEKEVDKRYLFQYLKAPFLMDYVDKKATGGTIKHLNQNILVDFPVVLPQKAEQKKIGAYFKQLDYLITLYQRKVDKLTAVKKSMLEKMFPKNGRDVPEIRFKGFIEPWEQRKLGGILRTLPFKQFLKTPEQGGKYEIIQQGNEPIIGYANGEPCEDFRNTVIFGDHTLSLYKPKQPFFVATDGVRILQGTNDMDGYYLLSLLEGNSPQSEGYKRYYSILSDREVFFTENHDEQVQIGQYFANLDSLITLYQRKLEKLQNIKKSMLERMFI